MSSYDCIVPISWTRLTETILPAWIDVLTQQRSVDAFCHEFAPDYTDFFDRTTVDAWQHISSTYLSDIKWTRATHIFPADNLRRSIQHHALEQTTVADDATSILCSAMRNAASVELPGPDRFSDTGLHRWYGRLHKPPYRQVAGTKSMYHFLEGLFAITHEPDRWLYHYTPRTGIDTQLLSLIQSLFLATRAFPAILVLPENETWPAHDDTRLQGYLMPHEVEQFVAYLDRITESYSHDPADDLFPLFSDRVRRAAMDGLALVTLHSELL